MRIHIIGASGSGKTYLSQKLAEKYNIKAYELDDLFWDNSGYNVKRDVIKRDHMLKDILKQDEWIIEGVQYAWLNESFENADVIYCLEIAPWICRYRIIKRFIKRKLQHQNRKNETIESLIHLLKWTNKFYRVNFIEIKETLKKYENKTVIIKKNSDIKKLIS